MVRFFLTIFFLFLINPLFANCKLNSIINISAEPDLLLVPGHGAPSNKMMNSGRYKIIEIKNKFVKVEQTQYYRQTGWLPLNQIIQYTDGERLTINDVCKNNNNFNKKKYETKSFPIKYDTTSTFSLNSDIGIGFYVIQDNTKEKKAELNNYEKNLVKKYYNFAITDFYGNLLPFAAYGEIFTSNKSPYNYSEVEGYFNKVKEGINLSSFSSNIIKINENETNYFVKTFKYHNKDMWENLTGSKDVDYFKKFNNCFSAFINDLPKNNTITLAATFTLCHKDTISKKDIENIIKSIHIKDYKTPTAFYDYKSDSESVETYQVNNKNSQLLNDIDQASKLNINLELELDGKLPNWHFNKNDDYYILGFDKFSNKLIGSAKFKDTYGQKSESFGDYYVLKNTYEDTITKPCSFKSYANTNYVKDGTLVAKGNVVLDCNGERKLGRWEQKGNIGNFVTDDKSIYGFFKKGKFDYLGTYLSKNYYSLKVANVIHGNVRSRSFEDPSVYFRTILNEIAAASRQFYDSQIKTEEKYIASKQEKQNTISKNIDSNYIYCVNKKDIVVRYSDKYRKKCPVGSNKTSELAWINNQGKLDNQNDNKSKITNLDIIFDTSEIKFVNATPLNIREKPNGKWLSIITKGEKVAVLDINEDKSWTKIVSEDGDQGWVSSKYLVDNLSKNLKENQENTLNDSLLVNSDNQDEKPELVVPKQKFDEEYPIISCDENKIFTKQKTALINCKISDNDEVFKVFINGNEVNLRANKIKEEFPVVIGNSKLEIQVFDISGNETKEFISVEREFNLIINDQEALEKLLPGSINARTNNNRIAIVIGIKDYKNIPDTKYADKDALTFIDYATDSLGIKPKNIQYLIDNKASILDLEELDQWLSKKIKRNTEVFFYYSGHGFNNNGESLLLPFDFRSNLVDRSSISKDSFIKSILSHNPEHIYAFFDACFSGLGREGETLIAGLRNISIAQEEKIDNVTIFNSASGAEFSSDYDEAGHGLFSYYLMKGLEGKADINEDQQISTSELYSYIEENVSSTALSIGFAQNPSLLSSQDKIILKW